MLLTQCSLVAKREKDGDVSKPSRFIVQNREQVWEKKFFFKPKFSKRTDLFFFLETHHLKNRISVMRKKLSLGSKEPRFVP